ncbi:hypothetical protein ACXO2V_08150 [Lactobacillus delbrueckii subsp. bulgaricus]
MMKEKNWLTWLTVLALVVGFAAMGASVWLSAQAAKQTQRNSQLDQEPGSFQHQKAPGQIGERQFQFKEEKFPPGQGKPGT